LHELISHATEAPPASTADPHHHAHSFRWPLPLCEQAVQLPLALLVVLAVPRGEGDPTAQAENAPAQNFCILRNFRIGIRRRIQSMDQTVCQVRALGFREAKRLGTHSFKSRAIHCGLYARTPHD
jgi:hypothetical protein